MGHPHEAGGAPAGSDPLNIEAIMLAEQPGMAEALDVAREYLLWCRRQGLTGKQIARACGLPAWEGNLEWNLAMLWLRNDHRSPSAN